MKPKMKRYYVIHKPMLTDVNGADTEAEACELANVWARSASCGERYFVVENKGEMVEQKSYALARFIERRHGADVEEDIRDISGFVGVEQYGDPKT